MIWIDLEGRLPTDTDIPGWEPWTRARWEAWKAESKRLVDELAELDAAGRKSERNALIDARRDHWSQLKPWLQALSAGKCWFSEVRELYSHYDVEHFRPKKEAKALDSTVRDGYWWLAFDHMNFRLCGNVGNRKKGGWFPLKEGSLCSTYNCRREASEFAYLIDPIEYSDVALLAFDEEGKVIPVPGASPWQKARVEETVKRLKLNEHPPLPEERRKIWQSVNCLIDKFKDVNTSVAGGDDPSAKGRLKEICLQLREMTQPDAELSAVARWCILVRNDLQLTRLIG
ncbi:hypothetical protein [Thiorhodococcus minor]|uniref:TIGR02646 family protein n=1 Tax=Thiorhodococcus minor TaxID=57489 RepID=A0A6M0JXJ6_9GAMM|nr:hypothetical protein [Thiorhodococcus minor]NEV62230.1 hypothetical protein [Thiorhodococcus minor]